MTRYRRAFLCALALPVAWAATLPAPADTNINFLLGRKALDSNDWELGDSQGELALLTTFGPELWPVQIAIDLVGSSKSEPSFRLTTPGIELRGEDLIQSTVELDIGVRKIWEKGKMRPFVGGGIALIEARQERVSLLELPLPIIELSPQEIFPPSLIVVSDDDQGVGGWIDGGIFWRLTRRFNLGLEARFSGAEVELFGRNVQAGGFHFGLLLGFGF